VHWEDHDTWCVYLPLKAVRGGPSVGSEEIGGELGQNGANKEVLPRWTASHKKHLVPTAPACVPKLVPEILPAASTKKSVLGKSHDVVGPLHLGGVTTITTESVVAEESSCWGGGGVRSHRRLNTIFCTKDKDSIELKEGPTARDSWNGPLKKRKRRGNRKKETAPEGHLSMALFAEDTQGENFGRGDHL